MRLEVWKRIFRLFFCLIVLTITLPASEAQSSAPDVGCGKAKVELGNPVYLTTSQGMIAVEPPPGWAQDQTRKNPFYFFKAGEKYENARTLLYINVQRLDVPFRRAVQNDELEFKERCQPSRIQDAGEPEILEGGCERISQMFFCERKQGRYVDLATKISVGGLLLNVVLSADDEAEIARRKKDYKFLLMHLALVK